MSETIRAIKYYFFSNVSISSSVSIRYKYICVIHIPIDHSMVVACVMFWAFRVPNCLFFWLVKVLSSMWFIPVTKNLVYLWYQTAVIYTNHTHVKSWYINPTITITNENKWRRRWRVTFHQQRAQRLARDLISPNSLPPPD